MLLHQLLYLSAFALLGLSFICLQGVKVFVVWCASICEKAVYCDWTGRDGVPREFPLLSLCLNTAFVFVFENIAFYEICICFCVLVCPALPSLPSVCICKWEYV